MKRVAIMQPYFMPYIGYISLIKHTDEFVLFDTPQFIRHGWIERNRILKQDNGWLYMKIPLIKSSRDTAIKDMRIDNSVDWKGKILAQLQPYKKIAPYYNDVSKLIEKIFQQEYDSIVKLNRASLEAVCEYLGIVSSIKTFSEMGLKLKDVNAPDEWALEICKAIGDVDEYWNPPGGQSFFDQKKYQISGIRLGFHTIELPSYDQKREQFEPGLSIIDTMMFNSPEQINTMLDNYRVV